MSDPFIPLPGRKPSGGDYDDFVNKYAKKHHEEYVWKGKEGIYTWRPEGELLGTVVFVHGVYDNIETSWNGHFGVLNDGSQSKGSLFTSIALNVLLAFCAVVIGAAAKKTIADAGATGAKITLLQLNVEPHATLSKVAQAELNAIAAPVLSGDPLSTRRTFTFL